MESSESPVWMAIVSPDYDRFVVLEPMNNRFVVTSESDMRCFRYSQEGETKEAFSSRLQSEGEYFVFGPFVSKKAVEQDLATLFAEGSTAILPFRVDSR